MSKTIDGINYITVSEHSAILALVATVLFFLGLAYGSYICYLFMSKYKKFVEYNDYEQDYKEFLEERKKYGY